jgi:hypothetical protein
LDENCPIEKPIEVNCKMDVVNFRMDVFTCEGKMEVAKQKLFIFEKQNFGLMHQICYCSRISFNYYSILCYGEATAEHGKTAAAHPICST